MSPLDRSNKENLNSVMEGIADKYSSKFRPHFDGEIKLGYEDNEFRLSGSELDSDFNFDVINDIYNDIQRKFTLSADSYLHIRVYDSFPKDRITIKSGKVIELKPTIINKVVSRTVTMQNINIITDLLDVSCSYIKLLNVNIESNILVLHDLTREKLCNNINGHIKTNRVDMSMNNKWDFDQMFTSTTSLNITKITINEGLNNDQINELQNINPIKGSKIGIFNTNTYRILHHDNCFVITREKSIINTFKELSYKMADGWYLIYTDKSINFYGITD
jgi:hypothetical protein